MRRRSTGLAAAWWRCRRMGRGANGSDPLGRHGTLRALAADAVEHSVMNVVDTFHVVTGTSLDVPVGLSASGGLGALVGR